MAEMKLNYDTLPIVAQELPDRSRLSLCTTNRTNYEMSYPALLRDNFAKGHFMNIYPDEIPTNCALSQAITNQQHELLGDIIKAVELIPKGGSTNWWCPFYASFCFEHNNLTALNMLRTELPELKEHLAAKGDKYARKSMESDLYEDVLDILLDAGWVTNALVEDVRREGSTYQRLLHDTKSGRALRALERAGFDPTQKADFHYLDHMNALQWRSIHGWADRDLLAFLLEKGTDIDTVASLGPVFDPIPSGIHKRYTGLDLASCYRNYNTMEHLLALGAAPGGSFEVCGRRVSSHTEPYWYLTSPLHEFLGDYPRFRRRNEIQLLIFSGFICLTNSEEVILEEDAICHRPTCFGQSVGRRDFRENLLQDVYALARLIPKGVKLLLDAGDHRQANLNIPGSGKPLFQLLALTGHIRARHRSVLNRAELWNWEDAGEHMGGHKCPVLEHLSDEMRILEPLADACDLLINAGAQHDVEEGIEGMPRFLRLLDLHESV